jgi:hypothetical protein
MPSTRASSSSHESLGERSTNCGMITRRSSRWSSSNVSIRGWSSSAKTSSNPSTIRGASSAKAPRTVTNPNVS